MTQEMEVVAAGYWLLGAVCNVVLLCASSRRVMYAAHLGLAVSFVAGLLGFWPEGIKLYQYQLFFFSAIIGSLAREFLSKRRRKRASVASGSLGGER